MGNTGLFTLNSEMSNKVRIHPRDKMCMLVNAGAVFNLKDETEIMNGVINANQTVIVYPDVPVCPRKYHAIVSYNPDLAMAGAIITPVTAVVRPGEGNRIALIIRASKKIDLEEIGHIFELYLID